MIFSEVLGRDSFIKRAELAAHSHQVKGKCRRWPVNLPKPEECKEIINRTYNRVTAKYYEERSIAMPAEEWIADNYHFLKGQLASFSDLGKKIKGLPMIERSDLAARSELRIYTICSEIAEHTDGLIDDNAISDYIGHYQKISPLRTDELALIEPLIRLALLYRVALVCKMTDRITSERQESELMFNRYINYIEGKGGSSRALEKWISSVGDLTPVFAETILRFAAKWSEDTDRFREILQRKLAGRGITLDELIAKEHKTRSALGVSIGNAIAGLNNLRSIHWNELLKKLSIVEQILLKDPSGIFERMGKQSRSYYVYLINVYARRMGVSAESVALTAIELAQNNDTQNHVGYYLYKDGYRNLKKAVSEKFKTRIPLMRIKPRGLQAAVMFISLFAILSVIFAYLPLIYIIYAIINSYENVVIHILLAIGLLLPLYFIVMNLAMPVMQKIFSKLYPPRPLPYMDFSEGVPDDCKVMCVIPAVLDSAERTDKLIRDLEIIYLANCDKNIFYAIIADFRESSKEIEEADNEVIRTGTDNIRELNEKYSEKNRFFFFYRDRVHYEKDNKYLGYERKRGAIIEFNELILGSKSSFKNIENAEVPQVKYVLTVDADTFIPGGSIRQMVEIMEHPLNKPVVKNNIVVDGYGILQPSVVQGMNYKKPNLFTRFFSTEPGVDCYFSQTSDFYFDTCYEGVFTGKGMYHPALFNAILKDAFPDNAILSHDLIEGSYLRTAFASNIRFYDSFPNSYDSYMRRLHRWTRGDWQLLPFKGKVVINRKGRKKRNPLNFLSLFKIKSNLVRSLLPVCVLFIFLLGMITMPMYSHFWYAVLLVPLYIPFLLSPSFELLAQSTLRLIFLPHEAYTMADAILRTIWRVYISKRNLLSWVTAADSEKLSKGSVIYYCRLMWFSFIASIISPGITTVLWVAAPFLAWLISGKEKSSNENERRDDRSVGMLARKIWAFFEDYAGAQDNYLPPDNVQFEPVYIIAHRTSPTNIGYLILSTAIAFRLGYITFADLINRLENILKSINKMEKWRGHLYNWYDTLTLAPLTPLFVSTVDSGNLMTALLCTAQILRNELEEYKKSKTEYINRMIISQSYGLLDLIQILNEEADGNNRINTDTIEPFIENKKSLEEWKQVLQYYKTCQKEEIIDEKTNVFMLRSKFYKTIDNFIEDIKEDPISALSERTEELIRYLDNLALSFDFKPLYNARKQLFSVGYSVSERRCVNSHYDIAASEARLTSYLAIAKGDVNYEHFFALGRRYSDETGVLLSWSGTAFEYLLPDAFFNLCEESLWNKTADIVLKIQKEYGKTYGIPWGVSESGYNAMEVNMNYKYKAFGVPELGIRRNPNVEKVVSPYSSLMAIDRSPDEVKNNLRRFKEIGASGSYGYYEAVDYTQGRQGIVMSFMSHHLGMSFTAIANYVLSDLIRNSFSEIPLVQSCKWLLTERMPAKYFRIWKSVSGEGVLGFLSKREIIGSRNFYEDKQADKKDRYNGQKSTEQDAKEAEEETREITTFCSALPECHLLSNGRYHVLVTADGTGYSKCGEIGITRWFGGIEREVVGFFIYVRVRETGEVFSLTFNPVNKKADKQTAVFYNERAVFKRRDGELESILEIYVSPEEDAEIRKVTFRNNNDRDIHLEITCVCELSLTSWISHISHPAYSDLMITTEAMPSEYALIAKRKSNKDPSLSSYACLVATTRTGSVPAFSFDTDFSSFMGRNRDYSAPKSMDDYTPLLGNQGAVITPCFAMRCLLTVHEGEEDILSFTIGYSESREEIMQIIDKYHNLRNAERSLNLAVTRNIIEKEYTEVLPGERKLFLGILAHMVYMSPVRTMFSSALYRNHDVVAGLWELGISGDNPIVTVFAQKIENVEFLARMIRMWRFFSFRGYKMDLAIITEEGGKYVNSLKDTADSLASRALVGSYVTRGGIYVIQPMEKNSKAIDCLLASSSVVLKPSRHDINNSNVVIGKEKLYHNMWVCKTQSVDEDSNCTYTLPVRELLFYNGYGGFTRTENGSYNEYVIDVLYSKNRFITTPRPWINCITGDNFGFIVSESGSGSIWNINSRENRITPWYNQMVRDPSGEAIYIQNMKNGDYFSATPLPCGHNVLFEVKHGLGYSIFKGKSKNIDTALTVFVPQNKPVKLSLLSISNKTDEDMKLKLVYYIRPVLADFLFKRGYYMITSSDPETGALLANNFKLDKFGALTAFVSSSLLTEWFTGDDMEFKGINGSLKNPAALLADVNLSNTFGAGVSPCLAIASTITIKARDTAQVVYMAGQTFSDDERKEIIGLYRNPYKAEQALLDIKNAWNKYVTQIYVETPDSSLNVMMNGWLIYQIKSCRLEGRTAFYQSGGAFGFRDQLQDCLALLHVEPERVRKQILLHASRQYEEGDVQHWWHEPSGAGIRSRYSDDLLWLPYCVYYYCIHTGDYEILKAEVPYLKSKVLSDEENERYEIPEKSDLIEPLIDHCIRTIKYSLKTGKHGLLLMGGGDWNDGMNRVGGESVWLSWFFCTIMDKFKHLCKISGIYTDSEFIKSFDKISNGIVEAIEEYCWDGSWYLRAFFEDGTPLGSNESVECSIDSLSQSWSAISGRGKTERVHSALKSAVKRLVDFDKGIIKLLTPPFTGKYMNPGYIATYPPGLRENGAQYTHGAIWLAMALLKVGWDDEGYEMLKMLNPINHTRTQSEVNIYKNEPYAVSADIYTDERNNGLGGWSFYTGSASWLYRTILEELLGISKRGSKLYVKPHMPSSWPGFTVRYRYGSAIYIIEVKNKPNIKMTEPKIIDLIDDGKDHLISV